MKPTSRYVFILGILQFLNIYRANMLLKFNVKSKFIIWEKTTIEEAWLQNLLSDLLLWTGPIFSTSIVCYCQPVIARVKKRECIMQKIDIRLRHDIVRQWIKDRVLILDILKSETNISDSWTIKNYQEIWFNIHWWEWN